MFRVDAAQLAKVPGQRTIDHRHQPRPHPGNPHFICTFAAAQGDTAWPRPNECSTRISSGAILRWIDTIPVWRGEADLNALRTGIRILTEGNIILLDPEGTRSHDGRLQKGQPGAILMALHSGAPMLPVVHYGSENYRENLKRLRRTDMHYVVGKPFRVEAGGQRVTSAIRQQMIDEVMYQMAGLLPPQYRGAYADVKTASHNYLVFEDLIFWEDMGK